MAHRIQPGARLGTVILENGEKLRLVADYNFTYAENRYDSLQSKEQAAGFARELSGKNAPAHAVVNNEDGTYDVWSLVTQKETSKKSFTEDGKDVYLGKHAHVKTIQFNPRYDVYKVIDSDERTIKNRDYRWY